MHRLLVHFRMKFSPDATSGHEILPVLVVRDILQRSELRVDYARLLPSTERLALCGSSPLSGCTSSRNEVQVVKCLSGHW